MVDAISITTHSAADTRQFGRMLGELLQPGDVVLLTGTLGAGKTLFAKGVATGLGVEDEITSPTFTLVNEYEGRHPFVHMDLYRLYGENGPEESDATESNLDEAVLDSIGFDEYLDGYAVLLIEWPQGVATRMNEAIHVQIEGASMLSQDERMIHVNGVGRRNFEMVDKWVTHWQS